jgi:hypothetical protein
LSRRSGQCHRDLVVDIARHAFTNMQSVLRGTSFRRMM